MMRCAKTIASVTVRLPLGYVSELCCALRAGVVLLCGCYMLFGQNVRMCFHSICPLSSLAVPCFPTQQAEQSALMPLLTDCANINNTPPSVLSTRQQPLPPQHVPVGCHGSIKTARAPLTPVRLLKPLLFADGDAVTSPSPSPRSTHVCT